MARLEHVNITVADPDAFADSLSRLFGWSIRWAGTNSGGERAVHVGGADTYVALFAPSEDALDVSQRYRLLGGLNHLAIVVDDLEPVRERVRAAGYDPRAVQDYEPGRRFYFDAPDGVEIEVVCYA